jgi:hemoglobin/transferrin/lactoferrin receptor protein
MRPLMPLLFALAAQAHAAECTDTPCSGDSLLEEIVVTARRAPQPVLDSSASLTVLDAAQLARSTAHALADVVRDVPGVQVSDAGQPGLKRIRIRGEESRRTAILVDGREITDHWEVGTPLSLHPAMVERVEVVRGSGSVLYGPRALSGVVNFLTRKGGSAPLQLEVSTATDSPTRGTDRFVSAYGEVGGTGYRLALAAGDHGDRDTPQGKTPHTGFENDGAYAWLGRSFGEHHVELSWEDYASSTEVFVEDAVRTLFPLVDFAIDVPQRDREMLAGAWRWDDPVDGLEELELDLSHQDNARRFDTYSETFLPSPAPLSTARWIYSDAALSVDDAVLQADWAPAAAHFLVSGVQLTREAVNQERHVDSVVNGVAGRPEDLHDEAAIETLALFAQDDWDLGERTRLTLGARHYAVDGELEETNRPGLSPEHNADTHTIASLGLTQQLADEVVLRASAAQGYVYPSLLQFATGAYAGSRFVNPNADLEPETSWSVETGLRARIGGWVLDTGIFHSNSEDYIDHVLCTAADACLSIRDKVYVNIGESEASGLEAYLARESGTWRPYLNLTWMKRSNTYEGFRTEDSGTPALAGTLGLQWQGLVADGLEAWADLALRGESDSTREEPASSGVATLTEDDAWLTVNLAAGTRFGTARRLSVVLELENLTDETYSTSAENLYAPGRSVAARVDLALE